MAEFGRIPPRSPLTFGAAGLLGDGCRVFYENIFSSRHLGRVSDLLAARLKEDRADELGIRAALLFGVLEACAKLPEGQPISIECGIDSEKIAVTVSFVAKTGTEPPEAVDELLSHFRRHAGKVILRRQALERRFEIAALIGIPGIVDHPDLVEIEVIELPSKLAPPAEAAEYSELGDLDYSRLLRDEGTGGRPVSAPSGGELLARAVGAYSPEEATSDVVSGKPEELQAERIASGQNHEEDRERILQQNRKKLEKQDGAEDAPGTWTEENTRIEQVTEHIQDEQDRVTGKIGADLERTRVEGTDERVQDETQVKVSGTVELERKVRLSAARIAELEKKLVEAEHAFQVKAVKASETSAGDSEADVRPSESSGALGGVFKKVWPFKRGKTEPAAEPESTAETSIPSPGHEESVPALTARPKETDPPKEDAPATAASSAAAVISANTAAIPANRVQEGAAAPKAGEAETVANTLLSAISSGGLSMTIGRIQKEAGEIRALAKSERVQKWIDGLLTDLMLERGRLNELAKNTALVTKRMENEFVQKVNQFTNRERAYQTELRDKERTLENKDLMISRLQQSLEQAKQAPLDGAALKSAGARPAGGREKTAASTELAGLQLKLDRTLKQLEEFKKSGQQLAERAAEAQKMRDSSSATVGDLKKRLESSMKMLTLGKKQIDRLSAQVDTLKKDESRLKADNNRLQTENTSFKNSRAKAPPRSAA